MINCNENDILENVSRETIENLHKYNDLLSEWQEKFNLVSNNSLPEAWNRHFLDSAQLYKYIKKDDILIYDFGSGAGFPALVLAIISKELNTSARFILIESISKKVSFLNTVINKFNLNAEVINDRIEKIKTSPADLITARALASLDKLFEYSEKFFKKNTRCLFLKGVSYKLELAEAEKKWSFDYKVYENAISEGGVVLEITNLRRKK